MKHSYLFFLLGLVALTISSCDTKKAQVTAVVKPVRIDSLGNAWENAWNTHNKDAIKALLAKDAIVFEDGWSVSGIDSLEKNFVTPNSAVIKTFTTTTLASGISEAIAYQIGNYTIETNQTPSHKINGPFTLIWKKQEDATWKVVSLQTGTVRKKE